MKSFRSFLLLVHQVPRWTHGFCHLSEFGKALVFLACCIFPPCRGYVAFLPTTLMLTSQGIMFSKSLSGALTF